MNTENFLEIPKIIVTFENITKCEKLLAEARKKEKELKTFRTSTLAKAGSSFDEQFKPFTESLYQLEKSVKGIQSLQKEERLLKVDEIAQPNGIERKDYLPSWSNKTTKMSKIEEDIVDIVVTREKIKNIKLEPSETVEKTITKTVKLTGTVREMANLNNLLIRSGIDFEIL